MKKLLTALHLVLSISFLANCFAFNAIVRMQRKVLQSELHQVEYRKAYESISRTLGKSPNVAFTCRLK